MIPKSQSEDLNSSISTIRGWVRDHVKPEDDLILDIVNSSDASKPKGDRHIIRRSTEEEDESSEESKEIALPSPISG